MALFKIFGNFASGNTTLPTSATQGYCYFDKNTGKFYIDTATSNTAALGTNRLALNADKADKDGNGNVISTTYLPISQANKVTQAAATTASGDYPVLLAYSTATSAITNSVNKTSTLKYDPSAKTLDVNGAIISSNSINLDSIIYSSTGIDADPAFININSNKIQLQFSDEESNSIELGNNGLIINDGTGVGTAGQALLSDGTKAYWGTISGGSSGDYVLKSGDTMTGSLIT